MTVAVSVLGGFAPSLAVTVSMYLSRSPSLSGLLVAEMMPVEASIENIESVSPSVIEYVTFPEFPLSGSVAYKPTVRIHWTITR